VRKNDFVIYGTTRGNPANPKMVTVRLVVVSTGSVFSDFVMQFQVMPGWQLSASRPDGTALGGGRAITRVLVLINLNNTPFQLNIKASYKFGSQTLSEIAVISALPPP
jgi:hypothetical protein